VSRQLRWILLGLISLAFIINFIDRQVLANVAPLLREEFGFSNTDYSLMVAAFLLGMALFQLPAGLLMDRKGTRFGFSVIVLWWSIASGLHAVARSVTQFCAFRFLLGAGECGNYSGGLKVIAQRFPSDERALAGGIFNSCIFIGTVIAPPLVVWLTLRFSWHTAFLIPSTLGLLWFAAWTRLFPRGSNAVEPDAASAPGPVTTSKVPIRLLLRRRQTWGVIVIRGLGGPLSHFYWFWLPEYLKRARGIDLATIGKVVWIPFVFAGLGNILGGYLSGMLLRRGHSLTFSRRLPFALGDCLAAASNFVVLAMPSLTGALVVLSVANLGANMVEPNFIGFVTDIFPQQTVGQVTGLTGIADNVMSVTLMLTTGIVLDRFSYFPVFMGAAMLPLLQISCVIWLLGPVKKLSLIALHSPSGECAVRD
jgi:ACS family hexuronate transporter-like MFS transporter